MKAIEQYFPFGCCYFKIHTAFESKDEILNSSAGPSNRTIRFTIVRKIWQLCRA